MSGFLGLGWDKGVNGHANTFVEDLPYDTVCETGEILKTRLDLEQDINDKTEECASYVKSKRFGSNRANALAACRPKILEHYQCSIEAAKRQSLEDEKSLREKLNSVNVPMWIGISAFVILITYLLTS